MKVHATFGTLRLVELCGGDGFVDPPATCIDIEPVGVAENGRKVRLWLLGADDGDMVKKFIIRGFNGLGSAYKSKEAIRETVNAMHAAIRPRALREEPTPCPDAEVEPPAVVTGQGDYAREWPKDGAR